MGADNALDLVRTDDGMLVAAGAGAPPDARMRAHFRSDAARLAAAPERLTSDTLVLNGVVSQSVYVGQGYRYRVRADGADVWVNASERFAEGTSACVVVPRTALLLFPGPSGPRVLT